MVQDHKNGKPSPSTFGIVGLRKATYLDGTRLKVSCTLCPTGVTYRSFATADFSHNRCPAFDPNLFIGCSHAQHVIAALYSQLDIQADASYAPAAMEQAICENMKENNSLEPGWYDLLYEMPLFGTFAVSLSDQWEPQILKVILILILDLQKQNGSNTLPMSSVLKKPFAYMPTLPSDGRL